MAMMPFILSFTETVGANAKATLSYTVPNNERLELHEFIFNSTGIHGVSNIEVTGGHKMTNADETNFLADVLFENGANSTEGLKNFKTPLVIEGGQTLKVHVFDRSGATNTIRWLFNGIREI